MIWHWNTGWIKTHPQCPLSNMHTQCAKYLNHIKSKIWAYPSHCPTAHTHTHTRRCYTEIAILRFCYENTQQLPCSYYWIVLHNGINLVTIHLLQYAICTINKWPTRVQHVRSNLRYLKIYFHVSFSCSTKLLTLNIHWKQQHSLFPLTHLQSLFPAVISVH